MSTFELACPTILRHEGGYINNKNDAGGPTKYGISLRWLKAQGLYGDVNGDLVVDIRDIQALTVDQAEGFYRVKWWDKYGYGRILDQTIATKIFDTAVNMGAPAAARIAQKAVNALGGSTIATDGLLGPNSIYRVNCAATGLLLQGLRLGQAARYRELATDPRLEGFLPGWLNRAFDRI